jgi:molybdopterin converting factor small subunit
MSVRAVFERLLRRNDASKVRVRVLIKGRIGEGWHDIDREFALPLGATLRDLIELTAKQGVPLRDAIDHSPHLRHTLMWNGERCPVDENLTRALADGDQLYLLAPLAGG